MVYGGQYDNEVDAQRGETTLLGRCNGCRWRGAIAMYTMVVDADDVGGSMQQHAWWYALQMGPTSWQLLLLIEYIV